MSASRASCGKASKSPFRNLAGDAFSTSSGRFGGSPLSAPSSVTVPSGDMPARTSSTAPAAPPAVTSFSGAASPGHRRSLPPRSPSQTAQAGTAKVSRPQTCVSVTGLPGAAVRATSPYSTSGRSSIRPSACSVYRGLSPSAASSNAAIRGTSPGGAAVARGISPSVAAAHSAAAPAASPGTAATGSSQNPAASANHTGSSSSSSANAPSGGVVQARTVARHKLDPITVAPPPPQLVSAQVRQHTPKRAPTPPRATATPPRVLTPQRMSSAKEIGKFAAGTRVVTASAPVPLLSGGSVPQLSGGSAPKLSGAGCRRSQVRGQTPPPVLSSQPTTQVSRCVSSSAPVPVSQNSTSALGAHRVERLELRVSRRSDTASNSVAANSAPADVSGGSCRREDFYQSSSRFSGGYSLYDEATPAAPSGGDSVPRLRSPRYWENSSMERRRSTSFSPRSEEEEAHNFISHRQVFEDVQRTDPSNLEGARCQAQYGVARSYSGSEKSSQYDSGSEPECTPDERSLKEVIRCPQEWSESTRSRSSCSSGWQPAWCQEQDSKRLHRAETSEPMAQQAQMQQSLKQLIKEAADGSHNCGAGSEHLQRSLEDWMAQWERTQQEQVTAADQQIRSLQEEVEQLRMLQASVNARDE